MKVFGLGSLAAGALVTLVALAPAPAAAQSAPLPTLVIYGKEKCPTNADGAEIVICVRRSAAEQFRIPKELRDFKVTPENESWAANVVANDRTAAGGIGSCSTVGPGGSTGCFLEQARATKRENQERKADQRALEASLP